MATSYCLNPELVFLRAASKAIAHMTQSNYTKDKSGNIVSDDDAFENNFIYGTLALSDINNYFESCLNSLLSQIYNEIFAHNFDDPKNNPFGISKEDINITFRKRSVENKFAEMVKFGYIDKAKLDQDTWELGIKIVRFANELSHYKIFFKQKDVSPHYDSWFLSLESREYKPDAREQLTSAFSAIDSKRSLGMLLTRPSMQKALDTITKLVQETVKSNGYRIQPNAPLFAIHSDEFPGTYIAS